jgi:hypothetical protein
MLVMLNFFQLDHIHCTMLFYYTLTCKNTLGDLYTSSYWVTGLTVAAFTFLTTSVSVEPIHTAEFTKLSPGTKTS